MHTHTYIYKNKYIYVYVYIHSIHLADTLEQHFTNFLLAALQKLCKVALQTYYGTRLDPKSKTKAKARAKKKAKEKANGRKWPWEWAKVSQL